MDRVKRAKEAIKNALEAKDINSNPILLSIENDDGDITYLFGADVDESKITSQIINDINRLSNSTSSLVTFEKGEIARRDTVAMFILYFTMKGEC